MRKYKIKLLDIHLNPSWKILLFEISDFGVCFRFGRLFIGLFRRILNENYQGVRNEI